MINRKHLLFFFIFIIIGVIISSVVCKQKATMVWTKSHVDLSMAMRKLWEDHIIWTRMYIVSYVDNLKDVDKAAARLLKNQEDVGSAIIPYYGDAAGKKLTDLLKAHIIGAVALLTAAKAGNNTAATDAEKKWYANADELATFLSSANPNWTKADLSKMLYDHLRLTKQEAVARLTKNYDLDISNFDMIHQNALMMADMLSEGIVKQFPDKFKE